MNTAYQIVVCAGIVPDPFQTLEPVASPAIVESQRDSVIQPQVARNELPWVGDTQIPTTLKGLRLSVPPFDPTPLGLISFWWSTQRRPTPSCNAGLIDRIPLGLKSLLDGQPDS
jgi:hypothetical protein